MSLIRRKSVSGCGAIRYDCRKTRDIARHQFQIDRPERLGEPRSAAGANQRDDILSLRGDACDRRLCGRRVQRSRDRTQPFGEIEIATQVLSLKPDAEVAVIFRRQIGVEVSAQEAAREHAVGRNRNAQRAAGIQKLPLEPPLQERISNLQINDWVHCGRAPSRRQPPTMRCSGRTQPSRDRR
jgi:hypothetical protein